MPNPTQIFLKATGDAKIVVGSDKLKSEKGESIIKVEYDELVIATIHDGPSISLERGPGWHQFDRDVIETVKYAERNPEVVGTGPTADWRPGEGPPVSVPERNELEADAMRHIADDAQKIMVEAREQQLANSSAALANPNVVGGANSANRRDPSMAARLYGALWKQRSGAIAAASAYVAFVDGGSASPEKKASEAEGLAAQCDAALHAFRAADAQWGYGQTGTPKTGEKAPTKPVDEPPAPEQPGEEDDSSIVDDILDFFTSDDDEER